MVEHGSPFICFDNVSKTYDGRTFVVRDLSLNIYAGEFLALLGPSGSGKTTTLSMLAGFENPTTGDITLEGRSLRDIPTHKRKFGMVFQNYSLFPHMTVIENVIFPLRMQGVEKTEARKRAQKALELVQLVGFDGRKPAQLSGGQQQRIALARAIVFEPLVILLDEPLGALDKRLREQLQIELRQIHKRLGVTMVYVTHDQGEALTMADRVAVFNDGALQQVAAPMQLYDEPETPFVAAFVGESSHLQGFIAESKNGYAKVTLTDGTTAVGATSKDHLTSSKVVLIVRPERVIIEPAETCANRHTAIVKELIDLGDQTRIRMSVAGNDDFLVKLVRTNNTPIIKVGQATTVGWESQDCRVLDAQ